MVDTSTLLVITDSVHAVSGLIDAIKDLFINLLSAAAGVIAASALVAKYMPPPEGNTFMAKIHKLINAWAQNAGHAENANSVGDEK